MTANHKPTAGDLGIDLDALTWQRSGTGTGTIEVAMVEALGQPWVLVRIADDPERRVLAYDRHEWECFIDGARGGEFDAAAG